MATETRYLKQRRGRWLVQVAVPKDLRRQFGKAVLEKYLGTSSLPEARQLRWPVVAELKARIERAAEQRPITSEEINAAAHAELRRAYGEAEQRYFTGSDDLERLRDIYVDMGADDDEPLYLFAGTPIEQRAKDIIAKVGAEETPETIETLSKAILDANVEALTLYRQGREPPSLAGQAPRRRHLGAAPSLSEAAERYLEERTRDPNAKPTAQTVAQMRTSYRLFGDYMQDSRLDEVTREDASGFLETIAKLHRDYGRSPKAKGLPLPELLRRYSSEGTGLSNRTLNRHAAALSGLYKWARKRGLFDGENPFAEQTRPEGRQSEVGWLPFTSGELGRLFEGLTFDVEPPKHTLATARPWVMLIALYSGMRQGEICELAVEDVREQDGIPYFDITASKSEAGVRRVPVHSVLLEAGWLDYVAGVRQRGGEQAPLFAGLTPGGPDKKRGHTFAKRFPAFRRDRGVGRERVTFHSFRKCFVRALELAQVDRDRAAQIVGHERGFTFRVYNPEGVDMAGLREIVEQVAYPGASLRDIISQTSPKESQ